MDDIRIKPPTLLLLLAVVGGGAFAAGNAMPTSSAHASPPAEVAVERDPPESLDPPGDTLPPGHPPIDPTDPSMTDMGGAGGQAGAAGMGGMGGTDGVGDLSAPDAPLDWKAPARWQLVPNTSTMRLATYRVPHAPGDTTDAELSVTRAGGSADANAERWIHQFDDAAQKAAKRSTRKVGSLDVSLVEVSGEFSAGMSKDGTPRPGWALLGAIVATPGTPHFFKLTGPARSVLAARAEFDALIGSVTLRPAKGI